MRFFITESGDPQRCLSEPGTSCDHTWHYLTQKDARAAYEDEMSGYVFIPLSKGNKKTGRPARFVATAEDLNSEFAAYQLSLAATAPALDRGDWRGEQTVAANRNGDLAADAAPNTSVSGYYDPTPDEEEDLSMFECF